MQWWRRMKQTIGALVGAVVLAGASGCAWFEDDDELVDDECNDVQTIPPVIDGDFRANDDCDVIDRTVVVDRGRLIVEPGTTLEFDKGAGLVVEDEGRLDAVGTEGEPIVFTGVDAEAGVWSGITIGGGTGRSIIEEATVEFGGGEAPTRTEHGEIDIEDDEAATGWANVVVDGGRLDLGRVTLADSAGWGLWLDGEQAEVQLRGQSIITASQHEPVWSLPSLVEALNSQTSYRGNQSDFIRVAEGTIERSTVWRQVDVPFLIDATITVDAHLWIEPGNSLVFSSDAGIEVDDDGNVDVDDGSIDEQHEEMPEDTQ